MFDTKTLIDLAEACEFEWRWYGRSRCFAIDTSKTSAFVVAQLIQYYIESYADDVSDAADLCDLLSHAKEDSMGLDRIVYWPQVEEIETEESDESE